MTAYEILMVLLVAFIAFNTFLIAANVGNMVSFGQKVVRGFTEEWKKVQQHESETK